MVKKEILTTQGIQSTVLSDGEPSGLHVLLADYDDGFTNEQLREEIEEEPGINVLLESSPGSFHWWNLTARGPDEIALRMLETHTDPRHIQIGYRRGGWEGEPYWVLRVREKTHSNNQHPDGEVHKEPPELKTVWYNETDRPQSRGHWQFVKGWFEVKRLPVETRLNWRGDSVAVDDYLTYTKGEDG